MKMKTEKMDNSSDEDEDLLPAKSRERYQSVYDTFKQWKVKKKVNRIKEKVMLEYFGELAKKYKPSSLWSTYSMLRSMMSIRDKVNLENYKGLTGFLKNNSIGYEGKKAKVFTAKEMKTFLDTAPDDKYLATKVVLIFAISGACQSSELVKLTLDDIENRGDVMVVKLSDRAIKTARTFTIEGEFRKKTMAYLALRPKQMTSNRLFIKYHKGRCVNQVIGKNKLGGMPREIAEFLNLPDSDQYTGHSFRRSSTALSADKGGDMTEIKSLEGLKSTTVEQESTEESVGYKQETDQTFLSAIDEDTSTIKFEEETTKCSKMEELTAEESSVASTSKIIDKKNTPEISTSGFLAVYLPSA